ncbi:MAG TPA: Rrf2 family transcriptional regulator [Chitinophagaceae bacterium]|nr:Rrf2 family transcriptional regulator [Chitinophagaceae bacterium]
MFSKTTEYALRATIYIARRSDKKNKPGLAEIAKAIDSPRSFTAKILQKLTRNNRVVSSVRGPNGGFFLTDKAKKLPVYAVLEAMGEDDVLTKCVLGLKQCSENKPCPMHAQYKTIKHQLIRLFETKTIRDLAAEITNGASFIGNKK